MQTAFDEMKAAGAETRAHYESYARWLAEQPVSLLSKRR